MFAFKALLPLLLLSGKKTPPKKETEIRPIQSYFDSFNRSVTECHHSDTLVEGACSNVPFQPPKKPAGFHCPEALGIQCDGDTNRISNFSASAAKSVSDGFGPGDRLSRWWGAKHGGYVWMFEPRVTFRGFFRAPQMKERQLTILGNLTASYKKQAAELGIKVAIMKESSALTKGNESVVEFDVSVPASDLGAARRLMSSRLRTWSKRGPAPGGLYRQAVTVRGRKDGFGSQLSFVWSMLAYALRQGQNYCRSPWTEMEHVTRSKMQELEKWAGLTWIPPCESRTFQPERGMGLNRLAIDIQFWGSEYFSPQFLELIRKMYWSESKTPVFDSRFRHIAVHYRAPDKNTGRGDRIANKAGIFSDIIDTARKDLAGRGKKPVKVHCFSKDPCPFKDVVSHNDWEETKTFHAFVTADAFIPDSSTFSWTGAFLNPNIVYYLTHGPIYEPPYRGLFRSGLPHWKNVSSSGKIEG